MWKNNAMKVLTTTPTEKQQYPRLIISYQSKWMVWIRAKQMFPYKYARRTSDRSIGIRLVGVKVLGIGDYVYLVDSTIRGGANLMIEIHRLTVLHLKNKNKLPTKNPKLYLE